MTLQVGQKLHCILYGGRDGVISQIHGQQDPGSIRHLGGGVIVTGGNAYVDVVWDNGTISNKVPESIVLGVQWKAGKEIVSPDVIAKMLDFAEFTRIDKEQKAQAASQAFAMEKARLIAANPHLKTYDSSMNHMKIAASNIRAELKQFKGVKFSVTSSHSSINVSWTDGVTSDKVQEIVNKYKAGHFNGMEDIYESKSTPWNSAFGAVEYNSISRTFSDDAIERAIDHLYLALPANLESVARPSAQDYENGRMRNMNIPHLSTSMQEAVYALAASYDSTTNELTKQDRSRFNYLVDYVNEALSNNQTIERQRG